MQTVSGSNMTIEKKSCTSCPSYLQRGPDATMAFKKNVGAPMCAKFGHVLGRGGDKASAQSDKAIAEEFATNCSQYGYTRSIVDLPMPSVAFPTPEVLVKGKPVGTSRLGSCAMCINFIPESTVHRELGWNAGMCSAKGRLILGNNLATAARGCEWAEFGPQRNNTSGMTLLPAFDENFGSSKFSLAKQFFESKAHFVEPHEYPTDKDVSAEDVLAGIRAWRKVTDPEGTGNFSFLPIFDPNYFDEIERSKIPRSGDDEHPEMYVDHFGGVYLAAIVWMELDETPALWGEAGVGKTELFRHLAWLMCLPFERISITATTELDDLIGKTKFTPERGTFFEYGRLPKAWNKPCVVVLDEPNTGQPEVWQVLRPLTDNSKQLVVDTNEGERITRNEFAFPGFAMNPAWDPKNVGTHEIGDADASRLFHVYIGLPPEELEREIISARVKLDGWEISRQQLDMVMRVATDVRALVKLGTLPITWGIRPQIKAARALRWFDPVTAYKRAIGDFMEPEAQEALLDQVRAHAPS